jgi:Na+/H+ antiporter NhaD/arsenite permease-like protein
LIYIFQYKIITKQNIMKFINKSLPIIFLLLLIPFFIQAAPENQPLNVAGIRIEFILFGLTLLGVAIFHHRTFEVALTGMLAIVGYKLFFDTGYHFHEHFLGQNSIIEQLSDKHQRQGEWSILVNLFGLLLGFGILAKIFEDSGVPDYLPKFLPDDWKGPAMLLVFIFIISAFLDNIAAAMIGGTVALVVFNHKVHPGYIAAIVATSNAGGSGSIVGDTTTTMMWIDGVSPFDVLHAYVGAFVALLIIAYFASFQQDKYQRITADPKEGIKLDYGRLLVVVLILIGAVLSNVYYDMPALGVWIAILIGATFRKIPWHEATDAVKGTLFLLCLVTAASLMPVETLPNASWVTAFALGFISAVFDNIPLTKLCLEQGHFDWGILAYSVGFGGSMMWFGSSAGVAITNKFPEARNVGTWLRHGWHIILAYVVGFFVLYSVMGWHPADNKSHTEPAINCKVVDCKAKLEAERNQLKIE